MAWLRLSLAEAETENPHVWTTDTHSRPLWLHDLRLSWSPAPHDLLHVDTVQELHSYASFICKYTIFIYLWIVYMYITRCMYKLENVADLIYM